MNSVAIVTDSNSGITQDEAKQLGIFVIPMPFYINGEMFLEGITLTQEEFYKKLEEDADISTSQPSPGDIIDTWEEIFKEYEEIVFIPMSSGLSGTCQTAAMLALDYDGKVEVVDNQRISVTQRQSVLDALMLAGRGKSASEIKEILEKEKFESSIYLTVETLKYLKKGGRITASAAAVGTILNIKPVLQIQGEKLDAYSKARGKAVAKKHMLKAIQDDFDGRFKEAFEAGNIHMFAAYGGNKEEAAEWEAEIRTIYPGMELHLSPLSLSIACHIGNGVLAVACSKAIPEELIG